MVIITDSSIRPVHVVVFTLHVWAACPTCLPSKASAKIDAQTDLSVLG